MEKSDKNPPGNFLYIKIFLTAIFLIVAVALVFHLVNSYSHRSFTQNSFNILILSDKYSGVVGVDKKENRFFAAVVTNEKNNINRENLLIQSINFGIPIQGYIKYPQEINPLAPTRNFFSYGNIKNILLNNKIQAENISIFDWIDLYLVAKKIDSEHETVRTYSRISDLQSLLGKESEAFFQDSEIIRKKTSLQVINGTNVNGLGGRVGEMFSRTGFNVVSILTNGAEDSKIIYSDENFYDDAIQISKSFPFPVEKSDKYKVSDITIIIGEESELELENLN